MSEPKYNSDELVPPSFLDEQFVVNLVKSAEKDPEIIVNWGKNVRVVVS